MAASSGIKSSGSHVGCGGVVVTVAEFEDGGVTEKCLYCGKTESAEKPGSSTLTTEPDSSKP